MTVVAPSHVAALQLRRRLAELRPFAAVRFETLPRIAELLGAGHLAQAGRSPLARPIGDYLAEQVARESQGILSQVGDLPGYGRVLRILFRRLRRGGIRRPEAGQGDQPPGHFSEVLRLYGRFREETAGFYDDEDLLDAAAEAVRSGRAGALGDLGAIYVLPPGAESAGGAAFLRELEVAAPAHVELETPLSDPKTQFVLAPDPASEAREVVREVIRALESGASLHEVAVFYGADRSYRKLLGETLAAAGIPVVAVPGIPLIETPAGFGVVDLATLPDREFARSATMDFLGMAPLRAQLPAEGGAVPGLASVWDRLSRDAGVTRGMDRWSAALAALVADREDAIADDAVAENEARLRALHFEREQAGNLQAVVERLSARLEPLLRPQPAASFISLFKEVVAEYFDPAAGALDEVLSEVDQLGAVATVHGTFDLSGFARALRADLETATIRERRLGDGVLVAGYRYAASLQFKHVVLCGCSEGAFPSGPGADVLVEDRVWAGLRRDHPYVEDASLRIRRGHEEARRAIASAGDGTLVWSVPLHEPGGTRVYYPSPLMVQAASGRNSDIRTASELRGHPAADGWLTRGPSPLALMLRGRAVDRAELGLRDAISIRKRGRQIDAEHPRWRAVSMLRARRGPHFTEWNGNLAGLSDQAWFELQSAVSPTSLEHYAVCGFRYLCRSLLRLNVIEEPEEREMMEPAARGTLIHNILRAFFEEQRGRGRPGPDEAWDDADRVLLLELAERELQEARRRGLTGLEVYANHEARTIRSDLTTFLDEDTSFRRSTGAVPAEFEVAIPETSIAGVRLRGRVDRVDRTPDGRRAYLIDYKSGSAAEFKKIDADLDPFLGGTKLQLPAYAAAAGDVEEAHAAYWFITRRGQFSRVGYEVTLERQALFEQTLRAIVGGIRAGAFPACSGDENEFYGGFENCRYCDFDRMCPRWRDSQLADKSADEGLSPWRVVGEAARRGSTSDG